MALDSKLTIASYFHILFEDGVASELQNQGHHGDEGPNSVAIGWEAIFDMASKVPCPWNFKKTEDVHSTRREFPLTGLYAWDTQSMELEANHVINGGGCNQRANWIDGDAFVSSLDAEVHDRVACISTLSILL